MQIFCKKICKKRDCCAKRIKIKAGLVTKKKRNTTPYFSKEHRYSTEVAGVLHAYVTEALTIFGAPLFGKKFVFYICLLLRCSLRAVCMAL